MTPTRVTIRFCGRRSGALGICYESTARRTIQVPDGGITLDGAKELARQALYFPDGDLDGAWERVWVKEVAFN